MPSRRLITLEKFRGWQRVSPESKTMQAAEFAAAADHRKFLPVDVESTSVLLRMPDGRVLDAFTTREDPFVLRVLDTPAEEFRAWQMGEEPVLEPRWFVRVMEDPLGRAPEAKAARVQAFIYPRTYTVLAPCDPGEDEGGRGFPPAPAREAV